MIVLELDRISKSYRCGFLGKRRRVLAGLSLRLEQGEAFGFLGHNGAGKTTTIKLILGLILPDSGKISIFGSPGPSKEARARIGFLGEEVGFVPHLDAEEMLELAGRLFRLPGSILEQRRKRLLEVVGLSDEARLKVKRYSKGMRQRLGIAIALLNDPDLLLLDEPYSGLDPVARRRLKDLLLSLKAEGKTILLSSHIVSDVEALCDRVGILKGGSIARYLDLRELYGSEADEVELTATGVDPQLLATAVSGVEIVGRGRDLVIVRCRGEALLGALVSSVYAFGGKVQEIKREKLSLEDYLMETLGQGREDKVTPQKKETQEAIASTS